MKKILDYNVIKYINSISGVIDMTLDGILNSYISYKKGEKYSLQESVSEDLGYINEEPFFVAPAFNEVKTNVKTSTLHPKFILFSA